MAVAQREGWARIAPSVIVHDTARHPSATDDWLFLYLRDQFIPASHRSMIELGTLGILMVYLLVPKGRGHLRIDWPNCFLGAAFMRSRSISISGALASWRATMTATAVIKLPNRSDCSYFDRTGRSVEDAD
jgi:hypothetical protein